MAEHTTPQQPENTPNHEAEGTGTENIVRRHLQDPNHVITDEEIRNVVVGKSDDEGPKAGAELTARFGIEDAGDDQSPDTDEGTKENTEFKPPNPWNVIK